MEYEVEFVGHKEVVGIRVLLAKLQQRSFHMHADYEIAMILDGELSLVLNNSTYDLNSGDAFVLNSYDIHAYMSKTEYTYILGIQISPSYLRKIKPDFGTLVFNQVFIRKNMETEIYNDIIDQLLKIASAYFAYEEYFEFEICSRMNYLFYKILKSVDHTMFDVSEFDRISTKANRMHRIMEFVLQNYQDKITLCDVAKKENVTPNYLSHFIKDIMGISFQDYLTKIRLDHAYNLVINTSLPMLDICMESGFSNHKYLNKAFEKEYSMSPKEYRKKSLKDTSVLSAKRPHDREIIYSHEEALRILKQYI